MNLEAFGRKLRELRTRSGLAQTELARQVPVSADLISVWERAYRYRKRVWRPDRASVLRLIEIFAPYLNAAEAQGWALNIDYTLGQAELQKVFPSYIPPPNRPETRFIAQASLPDPHLFGVSQEQQELYHLLEQEAAPWLVAIDGIGGIGKTSLAAALVREFILTNRFYGLARISAKQAELISRPALDAAALTDSLLEQLGNPLLLARSPAEKQASLAALLKNQAYLVVIDNLETVADYQSLVPALRQWANPTKFLLTTRHALHAYDDVYCFSLSELSQPDATALLKYEAGVRGATSLAEAAPAQLAGIYEVVGGNPLALKLVIGQIRVLPLAEVLNNLRQARGKRVDDLYTYIYWQAWHGLDEAGRQTLLVMPLAQNGTLDQLSILSELDGTDLTQALERLATLSLLEVNGDLEQPRYRIHRLTETFLLNEVIKWLPPTA
jgi:transcriptional regulator with XRE-family HTH domain